MIKLDILSLMTGSLPDACTPNLLVKRRGGMTLEWKWTNGMYVDTIKADDVTDERVIRSIHKASIEIRRMIC